MQPPKAQTSTWRAEEFRQYDENGDVVAVVLRRMEDWMWYRTDGSAMGYAVGPGEAMDAATEAGRKKGA